jgi:hypothetical protein
LGIEHTSIQACGMQILALQPGLQHFPSSNQLRYRGMMPPETLVVDLNQNRTYACYLRSYIVHELFIGSVYPSLSHYDSRIYVLVMVSQGYFFFEHFCFNALLIYSSRVSNHCAEFACQELPCDASDAAAGACGSLSGMVAIIR